MSAPTRASSTHIHGHSGHRPASAGSPRVAAPNYYSPPHYGGGGGTAPSSHYPAPTYGFGVAGSIAVATAQPPPPRDEVREFGRPAGVISRQTQPVISAGRPSHPSVPSLAIDSFASHSQRKAAPSGRAAVEAFGAGAVAESPSPYLQRLQREDEIWWQKRKEQADADAAEWHRMQEAEGIERQRKRKLQEQADAAADAAAERQRIRQQQQQQSMQPARAVAAATAAAQASSQPQPLPPSSSSDLRKGRALVPGAEVQLPAAAAATAAAAAGAAPARARPMNVLHESQRTRAASMQPARGTPVEPLPRTIERFAVAQEAGHWGPRLELALIDLEDGCMRSGDWLAYVFPLAAAPGAAAAAATGNARDFALRTQAEVHQYLAHPKLRRHLVQCIQRLARHVNVARPVDVFAERYENVRRVYHSLSIFSVALLEQVAVDERNEAEGRASAAATGRGGAREFDSSDDAMLGEQLRSLIGWIAVNCENEEQRRQLAVPLLLKSTFEAAVECTMAAECALALLLCPLVREQWRALPRN